METNKNFIDEFVGKIENDVKRELATTSGDNGKEFLGIMLRSFNTYCEQQRNGIDYLFDINNSEDLKCCCEGGLGAKDIARLYINFVRNHNTPLFAYDENHRHPELVPSWYEAAHIFSAFAREIVIDMLAYPNLYAELYAHCVTNYIQENYYV